MVPFGFKTTLSCLASVWLMACGARPLPNAEGEASTTTTTTTTTTTSSSGESGMTSSTDEPSTDPTDDDPTEDSSLFVNDEGDGPVPCSCADDELCISDLYGCHWDDDAMPSPTCVEAPEACEQDWSCAPDDPCVREVCGPWRRCLGTSCEEAPGLDMICEPLIDCFHPHSACVSGSKCTPTSSAGGSSWEYVGCIEAPGDDPPGSPCVREVPVIPDSCDEQSVCWTADVSDTPKAATCRQLCGPEADTPACPAGQVCLHNVDHDNNVGICLDTCDPLAPNCAPDLGCVFDSSTFVCMERISDGPVGQPCAWVNDCGAGSLCVGADALEGCQGSACCTQTCSLDQPGSCADGLSCVSMWAELEPPAGLELLGVCALEGVLLEFPERIGTGL